jgi:hypothetical protein
VDWEQDVYGTHTMSDKIHPGRIRVLGHFGSIEIYSRQMDLDFAVQETGVDEIGSLGIVNVAKAEYSRLSFVAGTAKASRVLLGNMYGYFETKYTRCFPSLSRSKKV